MHLIEILGPGCPRCDKATAEIRAVVERNHCEADVRHVTDPFEIVARGALFSIPVVLIDGVLVSRGRVPSRKDIERWLDVGSEVPVEASGWRGMGFFLFVLVASLLFDRLVFHPLPPAPMAPSVWIGLGPLGVGGLALVVLAQTAAPMWGDAAAVVTMLSLIVATALWGFGLWWLAASWSSWSPTCAEVLSRTDSDGGRSPFRLAPSRRAPSPSRAAGTRAPSRPSG